MSFIGRLLRGVRAGERGLLWNSEAARDAPASIELVCDAFENGTSIPRRHAGEGVGENLSPPLAWRNLPRGAVELALVIEDPDAPVATKNAVLVVPMDLFATGAKLGRCQSCSRSF